MVDSGIKQNVNIGLLDDDVDRILAAIYNLRNLNENDWFSSLEISKYLENEFGIGIHWRTIDRLLGENNGLINRRKRSKRWYYFILAAGEKRVTKSSSRIRVIRPSEAVESTLHLHDLLSSLEGTIRICDPYVDAKTLEHLDSCPVSSPVRLLSMTYKDTGKFRRLHQAFNSKGASLSVKLVSDRDIHDRYIIDDKIMYILGTSLNGFAKKQSFIIEAGEDIRESMIKEFDSRWSKANHI